MNLKLRTVRYFCVIVASVVLFQQNSAFAVGGVYDKGFYASNFIPSYDPRVKACSVSTSASTSAPGTGVVAGYTNPVYKNSAPDPAIIAGDDGMFYIYATGGVLLQSSDAASWKKIDGNWRLSGAPDLAGGAKWAPDVIKIDSKYLLTYTIPTGTPEYPGGDRPKIAYAVGDSAGGPFTYKGSFLPPYNYSIDSHVFIDDDGKIWMLYGGGAINIVGLSFTNDKLKMVGSSKTLLRRGEVGSTATIEGASMLKRGDWYYLLYSQGHYSRKKGKPAYRVLVARSKNVTGPYKPDTSMKPILEGKDPIYYPGGNSILTDSAGDSWIVYHGYYKNELSVRSLYIDPISYSSDGWPVINGGNGPSSSSQPGSSSSGQVGGSLDEKISNGDNVKAAWDFLVKNDLSSEQAAAIIGNLITESGSGISPTADNGGNYHGIAQWDTASRWQKLKKWAKANKLKVNEFDTQIRYLWKEATDRGNIKDLKSNKQQDVAHLTWYWGRYFEVAIISGDPDEYPHNLQAFEKSRKVAAEKVYDQYKGSSPESQPVATSTPAPSKNCSDTPSSTQDSEIGAGKGDFVDTSEVKNWEIVKNNAVLVDKAWGKKLVGNGWCAAIVARTWQGAPIGFGYEPNYAKTLWSDHRDIVHADHNTPKGAILIYDGSTKYGHVTIYLGNNKVLNDGSITDASAVLNEYLGWVDPNDLTWKKPQNLTDTDILSSYQYKAGH